MVGLITRMPRPRAHSQLLKMVSALNQASEYETGTWMDESLCAYAGWTARSNSFSAGMPLHNHRGDVTLLFSGEEYPAPGTARGRQEHGLNHERNRASYLVDCYQDDVQFPAGLNGWFHGLLADRRQQTLMLFNDRYGMQRLYYHESAEGLYFAVEAKSILAV